MNCEVSSGEIGTAVKHVSEKTGLDISGLIRGDQFLEGSISGSSVKVLIAVLDSEMVPQQKPVRWFTIKHLPRHHGDVASQQITGVDLKNLSSVIPFVQSLWEWIAHQSAFRQGGVKDTPDPRVKGLKPAAAALPLPTTPLRSASHSKTSSKSQPHPEVPIIAYPAVPTQESLRKQQDAPHIFTSSPYPSALLPSPHTPTHTPALLPSPHTPTHTPALLPSPQHIPSLFPSPQQHMPSPQFTIMYQGLGLSLAPPPPMTHYGTPLPAYRGPVHGYGPAYGHAPSRSHPVQPYSGRVGAWAMQDSTHAHQLPLKLECAQALVNFRFKGSVLT